MNRMHPGTFILSLILPITQSVSTGSKCTFQRLVRRDSFFSLSLSLSRLVHLVKQKFTAQVADTYAWATILAIIQAFSHPGYINNNRKTGYTGSNEASYGTLFLWSRSCGKKRRIHRGWTHLFLWMARITTNQQQQQHLQQPSTSTSTSTCTFTLPKLSKLG